MNRSAFVTRRSSRAALQTSPHPDPQPRSADSSAPTAAAHARYGHSFTQVAISHPPIQREADEDYELQMKSDPASAAIQREEDEDDEGEAEDDSSLQMKADPASTIIQREEDEDDEGEAEDDLGLQMKAEGAPSPRPNVPVASGGGSALPPAVLGKMERSFGHSFADVRIHVGDEAKQVGALAYTRGANIHFQPGRYDPASLGGQELLGHELTHVVQQQAGRVTAPQSKSAGAAPINADAGLEGEADAMGARAARGQAAHVQGASGGGLQRKADVVQRWPWSKKEMGEATSTVGDWAGYGTDLGGAGAAPFAAAQDWQGAAFNAQSITTAPSNISTADMAGGGLSMLGALSLPSTAINAGKGIKEIYKGVKTGDARRGLEGAGQTVSSLTSMGSTVANMTQGGALLAHASSLAGVAGGVAAPLGLATSTFGLGKSIYQGVNAQRGRNELLGLSEGMGAAPQDPSLKAAADFAADMQRKKRNRAVLNTTSNALIAGGSAATVAGAAGAGVGAAVGAGMAGAGVGLKYGAMGFRKLKQSSRDSAAQRAEDKQAGRKLGLWDRTVGTLSDKIFNPNTEKTTKKKNEAYGTHTATILGNKDVGAQIFSGLGANKSDLAKFNEYHDLKDLGVRNQADEARHTELRQLMEDRISSYMKVRE